MTFTPEQIARLPYQSEPAGAEDVVRELVTLASLITAIGIGAGSLGSFHDPSLFGRLIEDGTKEPGRAVVIQQARLALALESWVGGHLDFLVKATGEAVDKALPTALEAFFAAAHAEAHKPPIEMGPGE